MWKKGEQMAQNKNRVAWTKESIHRFMANASIQAAYNYIAGG